MCCKTTKISKEGVNRSQKNKDTEHSKNSLKRDKSKKDRKSKRMTTVQMTMVTTKTENPHPNLRKVTTQMEIVTKMYGAQGVG